MLKRSILRLGRRECHIQRLYSSSAGEQQQQPRRRSAPIATDFGGIQLPSRGKPAGWPALDKKPLNPKEFVEGSLSYDLAKGVLERTTQPQNASYLHDRPRPGQGQNPPNVGAQIEGSGNSTQDKRRKRQPVYVDQEAGQPFQPEDIQGQNTRLAGGSSLAPRPSQDRVRRTKREYRKNDNFNATVMDQAKVAEDSVEGEEDLVDDNDDWGMDDGSIATKTDFRLRRPDYPIPPPAPPPLPPLTVLGSQTHSDAATKEIPRRPGGYDRHFSPKEWKLARAQSEEPLGAADYASLILHLNPAMSVKQKKLCIQTMQKYFDKTRDTTKS